MMGFSSAIMEVLTCQSGLTGVSLNGEEEVPSVLRQAQT